MGQIITVVRVEFDNMENSSAAAIEKKTLGTFVDDGNGSAYKKAGDFLRTVKHENYYLGHDGRVYPQIKALTTYAR